MTDMTLEEFRGKAPDQELTARLRKEEHAGNPMKCHVCGTPMRRVVADLPFRVNLSVIIILRGLPLVECSKCSAYALEEEVMERVHEIVGRLRSPSHLEAVLYAASPVFYSDRAA